MILNSKKRLLRAAEKFALQGRFEQAIAQYLKVIGNSPDDPSILSVVGDLYTRLGKSKEAARYYVQVAEHYLSFNYLPKAIAVYRKVVQLEPNNFELALKLANLCDEEGQKSDALRQYQDLAQKYNAAGDIDNAISMLQKCVRLDPLNPHSLAQMGKILSDRGSHGQAETYLLDAAEAFLQRGYKRQAHPLFLKVLSAKPDQSNALLGLIRSCTSAQDFTEAKVYVTESRNSDKVDPPLKDVLSEALGLTALQWELFEEARAAFLYLVKRNEALAAKNYLLLIEKLIEKNEGSMTLRCLTDSRSILIRQGLTTSHVQVMRKLMTMLPDNPEVLQIAAEFYSADGDMETALECLHHAAQRLVDGQRPEEAIAVVETMLNIDSTQPEYWSFHENIFRKFYAGQHYEVPKLKSGIQAQPEAVSISILEESHFPASTERAPKHEISASIPSVLTVADSAPATTSAEMDSFFQNLFDLTPEEVTPQEAADISTRTSSEQELIIPSFQVKADTDSLNVNGPVDNQGRGQGPVELSSLPPESIREPDFDIEFEIIEEEKEIPDASLLTQDFLAGTDLRAEDDMPVIMEVKSGLPENLIGAISEEDISQTIDAFFTGLESIGTDSPKAFEENYTQGLAFQDIGMLTEAMEAFQKAFTQVEGDIRNPSYLSCCTAISNCALQLGQQQTALQFLEKAVQTPRLDKSQLIALRYQMAVIWESLGNRDHMQRELERLLSIDPEHKDAKGKLESIQQSFSC